MNGNELYRSISLHHIITRTSSFYVNKFKKKCYQKRIHAYDKTLYIFNEDNLRNIINISLCYASATQVLRWRRLGTTTATDANNYWYLSFWVKISWNSSSCRKLRIKRHDQILVRLSRYLSYLSFIQILLPSALRARCEGCLT